MLSHIKQFNQYASYYKNNNDIQKKVVKTLLEFRKSNHKTILDLGCGNGEVFANINWDFNNFVGVDASTNMCCLHPQLDNVKVINANFDKDIFFESATYFNNQKRFDCVISSSSIHWSSDCERLFKNIAKVSNNILLAIFTDKTFYSLNKTLGISSSLEPVKRILDISSQYLDINETKVCEYKIEFLSTIELLKYIKKTGISGGFNKVSV
jgi:malonyl-CoA O-methyltransferase